MIIQPEKEIRNVNDLLYEAERKRIEKAVMSVFKKVRG